jgi:hypothetical protein
MPDDPASAGVETMIWFVVAAVAVPLLLLATAAGYTWWSRRRRRAAPEVFVCRLRPAGPEAKPGWPRTKRCGCWAHDVLLVWSGPTLKRCEALPVASVTGVAPAMPGAVKGLGERPVLVRLHLDDGRILDLVANSDDLALATGPFVAASMM